MFLMKRLQRLFQADVNHVLDALEDPQAMLQLSIQEMEQSIHQLQQRSFTLQEEKKQVDRHIQDLEKKLETHQANLELSLKHDDHDLIRRQVRKKLELQKIMEHRQAQSQQHHVELKELEEEITIKKEKLDYSKQKEELISQPKPDSQSYDDPSWKVSDDDVELAYLSLVKEKGKKT